MRRSGQRTGNLYVMLLSIEDGVVQGKMGEIAGLEKI
jgi:hypothetical protein